MTPAKGWLFGEMRAQQQSQPTVFSRENHRGGGAHQSLKEAGGKRSIVVQPGSVRNVAVGILLCTQLSEKIRLYYQIDPTPLRVARVKRSCRSGFEAKTCTRRHALYETR